MDEIIGRGIPCRICSVDGAHHQDVVIASDVTPPHPFLGIVAVDGGIAGIVEVIVGNMQLAAEDAHALAAEIVRAAASAESAPARHARHFTLTASCPLCMFIAAGQADQLTEDE